MIIRCQRPASIGNGSGKTITAIAGLHTTTCRGDSFRCAGPHWKAPVSIYGGVRTCVLHVELWVLSFSVKEGRFTFGIMAGIWAKF